MTFLRLRERCVFTRSPVAFLRDSVVINFFLRNWCLHSASCHLNPCTHVSGSVTDGIAHPSNWMTVRGFLTRLLTWLIERLCVFTRRLESSASEPDAEPVPSVLVTPAPLLVEVRPSIVPTVAPLPSQALRSQPAVESEDLTVPPTLFPQSEGLTEVPVSRTRARTLAAQGDTRYSYASFPDGRALQRVRGVPKRRS